MMRFFTAALLGAILIGGQGVAQMPASGTIEKLPSQDPEIKTFVDTAQNAGLRDLFTGTGPFTIFAPSNAAFEKFGRLREFNRPEKHDALVDLLIYHVVPGKYMSNTLKTMDVKTISGKDLHIAVENGEIRANQAKVIRADLLGPNGVFYVIDTVLEP